MPELFIITGSNGAGKSSIGREYLSARIRQQGPIFDGDKLFIEKRKELWRSIKSHKECNKLAYAFVTFWLRLPQNKRGAFSMRNIKMSYYNKFLTDRIFANLDLDLSCRKIRQLYHKCLNTGALAA
jgi:hypothetical protein